MNSDIDILPENELAPLYEYWRLGYSLPESNFELLPPHLSPVRLLTRTELATIRVHALRAPAIEPQRHGVPYEAALRLAVFASRNELESMSGWRAATNLQAVWHPHAPCSKPPLRGLEILRAVDATSGVHGVTVTVGQHVSLAAYCAEIGSVQPSRTEHLTQLGPGRLE